jgi:hypothetical protein
LVFNFVPSCAVLNNLTRNLENPTLGVLTADGDNVFDGKQGSGHEISGSHCSEYEDDNFLGCSAV